MTESFLNTIYIGLAFVVLFVVAEWMHQKLKWRTEITRKFVHIVTGLLTLTFPIFIDDHWFVLLLCGGFFLILSLSLKFDFIPSINDVERKTHGSLIYPVVVYGCYLLADYQSAMEYFYLPILILAIADPAAGHVGRRWPIWQYQIAGCTKSLGGNLGFLVVALGVSWVALPISCFLTSYERTLTALLVAFLTAIAEAIGIKGWDNLTIPLTAILSLFLFQYWIVL